MQAVCFIPYVAYMHNYREWAMKRYPAFRFAPVLAILRRVFDQLVNRPAVSTPPPNPPSTAPADRPRSYVVGLDSSV